MADINIEDNANVGGFGGKREVKTPENKPSNQAAPQAVAAVAKKEEKKAPNPLSKPSTEEMNAPVAARAAAIAARLPGKVNPVQKVAETKETAATRRADDAAAKFLAARELRNRR